MPPRRALHLATLSLACAAASAQTPQFALATPPAILAHPFARLTTADVDGDGDQDVLGWYGLSVQPGPTLLRNDGDGAFTDVTATQLPLGMSLVLQVVPFDADGDGDLDLFVSSNIQSVVLKNSGSGAFSLHQLLPQPFAYYFGATAGDFDNDGDVDIAVAGTVFGQSQHQVLVNGGTGTLTGGPTFGTSLGAEVAAIDFDGDLDLDLLFTPAPLRLWRNDGNLQFTDVSATNLVVATQFARFGGVTDLDGDGAVDVVLIGALGDGVLRNVQGVLVETTALPAAAATNVLTVGDVDRDGLPDVVRSSQQGGVELLRNTGGLVFAPAPNRLPATPVAATYVSLADLDRDGDPEILSVLALSPTRVLLNRDLDLTAGPAAIGQTWSLRVLSEPGYASTTRLTRLAITLAGLSPPLPIPGFGELQVDPGALVLLLDAVLPAPAGEHTFALAVPNAPALIGLVLFAQALVERGAGPLLGNRVVVTIG